MRNTRKAFFSDNKYEGYFRTRHFILRANALVEFTFEFENQLDIWGRPLMT